jgi:hypothetical protein
VILLGLTGMLNFSSHFTLLTKQVCIGKYILTIQAIFTRVVASFNALTKSGPIQNISISCSCFNTVYTIDVNHAFV